jgi:hypothetical protein
MIKSVKRQFPYTDTKSCTFITIEENQITYELMFPCGEDPRLEYRVCLTKKSLYNTIQNLVNGLVKRDSVSIRPHSTLNSTEKFKTYTSDN